MSTRSRSNPFDRGAGAWSSAGHRLLRCRSIFRSRSLRTLVFPVLPNALSSRESRCGKRSRSFSLALGEAEPLIGTTATPFTGALLLGRVALARGDIVTASN